jgi:hypothetical protein
MAASPILVVLHDVGGVGPAQGAVGCDVEGGGVDAVAGESEEIFAIDRHAGDESENVESVVSYEIDGEHYACRF